MAGLLESIRAKRSLGFTLIELVVTLAILALLATAVIPVAETTLKRQREQELRQALREMRQAIDAYKRAVDEGRIQRQADETGYPSTLEVLVEGVEDLRDPKKSRLYFLRRIPEDPFSPSGGHPEWGKRSYASEPDDPQEGKDVYDVYSRSSQVGLNGVPYRRW